jgi:hypothetical protein
MTDRPNISAEIERLIDASSLLDVLTALECVCGEKAEHIRHNWQDKTTARPWDKASRAFGKLARETDI